MAYNWGFRKTCACFCAVMFVCPVIIIVVVLAASSVNTRNAIRFSVTDAFLAKFEISDNNTLRYDLLLEMAVIKRCDTTYKLKYYQIEANGYYGSQRFSYLTLNPFVQYPFYSSDDNPCRRQPDSVNILRPVFKGQNTIILDATDSARFGMEKKTGVYNIVMEMQLRIRVIGPFGRSYRARVGCGLKVPLTTNGRGGAASMSFNYTRCNVHYNSS